MRVYAGTMVLRGTASAQTEIGEDGGNAPPATLPDEARRKRYLAVLSMTKNV